MKAGPVTSRRVFLVSAAALAAGCTTPPRTASRAIGIQTYMLGEEIMQDFPAAMRAVADMGYKEIETSISEARPAETVREVLDANGLTCPSVHMPLRGFTPGEMTLEDTTAAARAARVVGARFITVPMFPWPAPPVVNPGESVEDAIARIIALIRPTHWTELAATLNEKGAALKQEGVMLAYHNHNAEFGPGENGTGMDVLIRETDPDLVCFEIDIAWVASTGIDPADFIRTHGKRVRMLHVKDLAETPSNTAMKMNPSDLGAGAVDWSRVLAAAADAGVEHYFVEQEPPFTRPRLEAARIAYDFLSARL